MTFPNVRSLCVSSKLRHRPVGPVALQSQIILTINLMHTTGDSEGGKGHHDGIVGGEKIALTSALVWSRLCAKCLFNFTAAHSAGSRVKEKWLGSCQSKPEQPMRKAVDGRWTELGRFKARSPITDGLEMRVFILSLMPDRGENMNNSFLWRRKNDRARNLHWYQCEKTTG